MGVQRLVNAGKLQQSWDSLPPAHPKVLKGLLGELEGLLGASGKGNLQAPSLELAKSKCVSSLPLLATWWYCLPSAGGDATGL